MVSPEDMTKWLKHLLHNLHFKDNDSGVNMLIADAFHQGVTVPADHKDGVLTSESEVALGYGMGWYASTYGGENFVLLKEIAHLLVVGFSFYLCEYYSALLVITEFCKGKKPTYLQLQKYSTYIQQ